MVQDAESVLEVGKQPVWMVQDAESVLELGIGKLQIQPPGKSMGVVCFFCTLAGMPALKRHINN
jgi:hypothetical protein